MATPIRLTEPAREQLKNSLNAECDMRLPNSILEELIDMGEAYRLKRGEAIIPAGVVDTNIYILMEGIMRTWYYNGDQEVTQAFATKGTLVVSNHSYYAGEPSAENYEACCPSKVLKIKKEDFESLLDRSHIFARWNVRLSQCQLYRYEVKRRVINGPARERYEALIHHRSHIIRNVPLKVIATYLNITPEYLSKLRRMLSD